jgi:transcriptional regulator GlxA family with amidase domain
MRREDAHFEEFTSPPGTPGAATTERVAARHGVSRRQLERRVRALTNRSPKALAALARFTFVRDALWARPDADLRTLALEAGYADQAHLTRDFRRYAGRSSGEFKRDCVRLAELLRAQDVAIVQDGARETAYDSNR